MIYRPFPIPGTEGLYWGNLCVAVNRWYRDNQVMLATYYQQLEQAERDYIEHHG